MSKIFKIFVIAIILFPFNSNAQFSLQKGDHLFEIGGNIISGYNYRFYPSGTTDFHKDNFVLDEARFFFKGRVGSSLQYKYEMDIADLIADIQTPSSYVGVLKDANIEYKTKFVSIKTGYQKVPYGFNSDVAEIDDPFLNRPLVETKINSRRDLGVTLSHWFPQLRLSLYAGAYSGMGEEVFSTDNSNGKPEYIGRVEYSYPGRNIDQIVDMHKSPRPMFQCGVNARYMDGSVTSSSDYNLININGKKTSYGFDASLMYQGFSLQVESHQMKVLPVDSSLLFSEGKIYSYFKAGGYLAELNYFCRPLNSVFCVRYDELNPSDLIYGSNPRTLGFAYNYLIRQNFLSLKLQYLHHLPYTFPANAIWKDDDLTLEFQVLFN
ncbi:MAG: porin [Bacteroidota bacterium]